VKSWLSSHSIVIFSIVALSVGLDRITKIWAKSLGAMIQDFQFAGIILRLQHAENPGAFLSLGSTLDSDSRYWLFVVVVTLVISVCLFAAFKSPPESKLQVYGLSLLAGGGIGNLIDRMGHGAVTDFLWLGVGPLHTGVFNIADMAILAGVGFMMLEALAPKKQSPQKQSPS
jgi:signal peptidase II